MSKVISVKDYNAEILQRIRVQCVKQETSIPKIEKALGYGNGSISSWKNAKRIAPIERVQAVADYLSVPIETLIENLSHETDEKKPATNGDGLSEERAEWANAWGKATPAQRKAALAVLMLQVPPAED